MKLSEKSNIGIIFLIVSLNKAIKRTHEQTQKRKFSSYEDK